MQTRMVQCHLPVQRFTVSPEPSATAQVLQYYLPTLRYLGVSRFERPSRQGGVIDRLGVIPFRFATAGRVDEAADINIAVSAFFLCLLSRDTQGAWVNGRSSLFFVFCSFFGFTWVAGFQPFEPNPGILL